MLRIAHLILSEGFYSQT